MAAKNLMVDVCGTLGPCTSVAAYGTHMLYRWFAARIMEAVAILISTAGALAGRNIFFSFILASGKPATGRVGLTQRIPKLKEGKGVNTIATQAQ